MHAKWNLRNLQNLEDRTLLHCHVPTRQPCNQKCYCSELCCMGSTGGPAQYMGGISTQQAGGRFDGSWVSWGSRPGNGCIRWSPGSAQAVTLEYMSFARAARMLSRGPRSRLKPARSRIMTLQSVFAMTSAARGWSLMSDSSPK